MMHHYRQVIRNTYFPASKTGVRHGSEISTECPIQGCTYKASFKSNRLEHLTMHIG